MSYCIVTEWEDGTVAVTAIEGGQVAYTEDNRLELTPEALDRACWLVAAEIERGEDESPDKARIHAAARGTADATALPHYYVGEAEAIANGEPEAECYVQSMGVVRLGL